MDISSLRKEYTQAGLERDNLLKSPLEQFGQWFDQAYQAGINEPNAMSLATVDEDHQPSVRTVLLKSFDPQGFIFFTNYESLKGQHIAQNPRIALLFPWLDLERQVIIRGQAEKVPTDMSLQYFSQRPEGSKWGAWTSQQSRVIPSRQYLEQALEDVKKRFKNEKITLPPYWGGYRVMPHTMEFWQGRPNRLHDRFCYSRDGENTWKIERLSP